MRHASIVDNLLPALFVAAPHGLRLRYVLKRELLSDPAIDIAGGRLPNCFVRRGADDAEAEIARVRALAAGLGPDEGVLIYPEGTRFTAAKRERAIERQPRAAELRNVPPPRPGGTLAVMETGADVVICAHHGLDGFASIGDPGAAGSCGGRCGSASAASPAPRCRRAGRRGRTGSGSAGTRSTTGSAPSSGGVSAGEILLLDAAVIAGLMIALWLVSLRLRDASIVDPFWGSAS